MGLLTWIKKVFSPKEIKPAYRSEADKEAVDYYNSKTSFIQQHASNDSSDAMEP